MGLGWGLGLRLGLGLGLGFGLGFGLGLECVAAGRGDVIHMQCRVASAHLGLGSG